MTEFCSIENRTKRIVSKKARGMSCVRVVLSVGVKEKAEPIVFRRFCILFLKLYRLRVTCLEYSFYRIF